MRAGQGGDLCSSGHERPHCRQGWLLLTLMRARAVLQVGVGVWITRESTLGFGRLGSAVYHRP
ncbi:hypothetical protein JDM601_2266 [Mycolicibacter sinensis]|uniref:Uncharacterized protein n=1 Tax=Mycolicibacter sinensis (strain JDM601) TaxID=875328 RepID=F5YU75_MYCSD|nr:hypothetical protein JDM601_2266 [Mycolicibacter sinensis]